MTYPIIVVRLSREAQVEDVRSFELDNRQDFIQMLSTINPGEYIWVTQLTLDLLFGANAHLIAHNSQVYIKDGDVIAALTWSIRKSEP